MSKIYQNRGGTLTTILDTSLLAPKASPAFTGTPTAPTAAAGTNTKQIATTAFVKSAVDKAVTDLVGGAGEALDTLKELETALGGDPNFAATITNSLAETVKITGNQSIAGTKTFTGGVTLNQIPLKVTVKDSTEGSTTTRTDSIITANSSNTSYGANVLFGSSGNTIVGSGEGKNALLNELAGNSTENIHIISDGSINFYPNANTYANKKTITLGADGKLTGLEGVTATTFTGALTGNASTSTSFASNQIVELTGDVTGSASSKAGWSVTTKRRSCMVGQSGSNTTNPWYKFATVACTTANDDIIITFLVEDTYSSHKQGIMKAHIRTDGNKVVTASSTDLIWVSHTGYNIADFVIAFPSEASPTVELWTKIATGYMYRRFTVLSEGSRSSSGIRYTLLNASSAGQASGVTTAGTRKESVLSGHAAVCSGNAENVTGVVTVQHGGTGLTASPSMLTNLASTTAANVMQASPRPGVTGTLPVANGGTGQTSVANIQAGKDSDGNTIKSTYLKLAGGTVTGTLILSRNTDASGTANNKPALIVGGTDTTSHIEIDNNEIVAKATGTTVAPLYLNADGGIVYLGGNTANYQAVTGRGKGSASLPVYTNADGIVTACGTSLDVNITKNAATATKATQDVDGNAIKTTYAKLASPAFTGTPTAPTAAAGTNNTQVATTAYVTTATNNVSKQLTANTTIYVATSAAGNGSGSTAANAMDVNSMWKYLSAAKMLPELGKSTGSRTLTVCFAPGDYGEITFDANKMPGVKYLTVTTSTGTTSTTSNYTTNCPTFTNIYASGGDLFVTLRNVYATGTIQAHYHARIVVDTFVGAARFVADNYGRLEIGNGVYAIKNAGTDYLAKGTQYGQMMIITKTANFHFMDQCYFTGGIYGSDTGGRIYIRHDYAKLTGTKPIVSVTVSATTTGTSSTAAGTAAKAVTLASGQTFTLANNAVAYVTFDNTNTAANPTLNINGTGAKPIYLDGAAIPKAYINKHTRYKFTYNGTQYVCGNTFNRVEVAGTNSYFSRYGSASTTYNEGTFNWSGWSTSFTNGANAAGVTYGSLSGNASTATEFSANKTVKLTGDVTGSTDSTAGWTVNTTLKDSGVTAGSYGPSADATPGYGATFNVPYITVDAQGRVTSASTKKVKIPASDNTNTDTKVNVTLGNTTKAYLLGTSTAPTSTATAVTAIADSGVYLDTAAGKLTATTFAGSLSGNASSATEFSANKSVTLTGDVTGTAASKGGWSIATTLANSGVTAGSYGPTADATPGYGSTFSVPYIEVDVKGRVKKAFTRTVKIPASDDTNNKVTQTVTTANYAYPILLAATSAITETETNTSRLRVGTTVNTSTGELTLTGSNPLVSLKDTGLVHGTSYTSDQNNQLRFRDSNDENLAYISHYTVKSSAQRYFHIGCRSPLAGSSNYAYLRLYYNGTYDTNTMKVLTETTRTCNTNADTFYVNPANGTAGTQKWASIVVGNSTSSSKANHAAGRLQLYGESNTTDTSSTAAAYYANLRPTILTANRTHTLPNASGFLATGSTAGVGSSTQPVYMKDTGVLAACGTSLGVSITGNAATATEFSAAKTVALTGDVTGSASSKAGWSFKTTLADSGVTAGSYGPTADATPGYGSTFSVPYIEVDAKGRVKKALTRTVKIPASDNTNTDTKVNVTLGTTTKAYLLGTTTTPTSTATGVTAIADTGVYLDTTAGKLTAKTFSGSFSGNASSATAFASAQTVALTGDVIGSVSSTAGWTVSTKLKEFSNLTAGSYGPTVTAPAHGSKINIPYITVDKNGRITAAVDKQITLPADNNTDTKVNVTLGKTTKAYLLGTSTTPTSTAAAVTAIADTGVYLDTTEGKITATTFNGNATTASKLVGAKKLSVNLGQAYSNSSPSTFDGSADQLNIQVAGTLPVGNGGTGLTSLATFVRTSGDQNIAGIKTFTQPVNFNSKTTFSNYVVDVRENPSFEGLISTYKKGDSIASGKKYSAGLYIHDKPGTGTGSDPNSTDYAESTRFSSVATNISEDKTVSVNIAAYKNKANSTDCGILSIISPVDGNPYATCPNPPLDDEGSQKIVTVQWIRNAKGKTNLRAAGLSARLATTWITNGTKTISNCVEGQVIILGHKTTSSENHTYCYIRVLSGCYIASAPTSNTNWYTMGMSEHSTASIVLVASACGDSSWDGEIRLELTKVSDDGDAICVYK